MTRRSNASSPAQRASGAANENYRELQAEVLETVRKKLSARRMSVDESDLEEAYCLAWHGVVEKIKRGDEVSNLTGLLVKITWRRAVDAYREARPGQRVQLDLDQYSVELDVDAQLDDQIKLNRFIKAARGRLNPRECEAVSLCVIQGYPRAQAAELLGLKRSQMEKIMDSATKKLGGVVASITTRGCGGDEWARLIKSYALGLIAEDDRDYPRAAEHVAQCQACRRYVNGLRGLGAILPPFVAPLGPAGAAAAAAGHGVGIRAHLERLFGGHGGAGTAGATNALRTAGAGAGGAGGGTLASSIGTGTVLKGAAVVAAAGVALALAGHSDKAHHRVSSHGAPAAQERAQVPPAIASVSSAAPATHTDTATVEGPKARAHTRGRHPPRRGDHTAAVKRVGHVDGSAQRGTTPAPGNEDASYSAPAPSAPAATTASSGEGSVSQEFNWER